LAAIAIAAVAVVGAEDRGTLVPPPDAVAEEFGRQLVTGRAEQALPLLSETLRSAVTPEILDACGKRIEAELGAVGNVSGELHDISGDRAQATAVFDGRRGTRRVRFGFAWDDGRWVIHQLGDLRADGRSDPAS
jgi:hypothetical protein